jgi:hypothetical protein
MQPTFASGFADAQTPHRDVRKTVASKSLPDRPGGAGATERLRSDRCSGSDSGFCCRSLFRVVSARASIDNECLLRLSLIRKPPFRHRPKSGPLRFHKFPYPNRGGRMAPGTISTVMGGEPPFRCAARRIARGSRYALHQRASRSLAVLYGSVRIGGGDFKRCPTSGAPHIAELVGPALGRSSRLFDRIGSLNLDS